MEPQAFEEYWNLKHSELAALLGGYTADGVANWFRKTQASPVPEAVKARLLGLHVQFLKWEDELLLAPHERETFEIAVLRRRKKDRAEEGQKD